MEKQETNIAGTDTMDVSPIESKIPDAKAPARLKEKAPAEWESAGYSQYIPFTSTKYDAESFAELQKEWEDYSKHYMAAIQEERYTKDAEMEETLQALKDLKLTYGTHGFIRALETARNLNEDLPQIELDSSFLPKLNKMLVEDPLSDITIARARNLAKTEEAKFSNKEIHPSELFEARIEGGDELRKKPYEKNQVLADSGASITKGAETEKDISDGLVTRFHKQSNPVLNAFKQTILNNLHSEVKKANKEFAAEEAKRLDTASKVRSGIPTSYAAAARKKP